MKIILVIFIIILFLIGLFSPFVASYLNQLMGSNISINEFDSNFLVTSIASIATLASVFFIIYGWYSIKELPNSIEKVVDDKISAEKEKILSEMNSFAEASQKMNAIYGIKDPDQKIELLEKVIELYPKMFNARITMAYTYWYDKKDYDKAQEWFESELNLNPENINALCDLVALHDELNESRIAVAYAKKAININNNSKQYLIDDKRLKLETKNVISRL